MAEAQELRIGNGQLAGRLAGAFAGAAVDALKNINLDAYRPKATELALSLFDKLVQYDVPGVPAILETAAEAAIRNAIPGLVDRLFDSLKKPNAGETAATAAQDAFAFLTAPQAS